MDHTRSAVSRYTIADASRYLQVPYGTVSKWTSGYSFVPKGRSVKTVGRPIVHTLPARGHDPRIPFAGLVEAFVIKALRSSGVSLQAVRRIIATLRTEFGDEWALTSERLLFSGRMGPSGPEVLYNYAERHDDPEVLVVVGSRNEHQRVFAPVVNDYLERIVYHDDMYAGRIFLPLTQERLLMADPYRNGGHPIFASTAAPVDMVLSRVNAGEPIRSVANDYGLDTDEVRLAVQHASQLAA